MDKRYTDSEYLFKNFLLSKLNLKATYLDIPDNNCFYLCISEVIKNVPYAKLNGHPEKRLPGHVNISLEYIEAEASLLSLDLAGIECSSGSACASGSFDPSHVLLAMGLSPERARGALRFTMGKDTTKEQIDYTIAELKAISDRLVRISPLFAKTGGTQNNV